ncbi:MAG: DHHA1 domain-containing protein, partial [Oscillospiraceae bacterium]
RVLCSQAADEMLYIRNVDASFTVYPIENGWSISARSLGKINVQVIMESLGNKKDDGGGHQSMAGAQLYDTTLEDAVDRLHTAIDDYLNNTAEEKQ